LRVVGMEKMSFRTAARRLHGGILRVVCRRYSGCGARLRNAVVALRYVSLAYKIK
jgi:hypothetical protein